MSVQGQSLELWVWSLRFWVQRSYYGFTFRVQALRWSGQVLAFCTEWFLDVLPFCVGCCCEAAVNCTTASHVANTSLTSVWFLSETSNQTTRREWKWIAQCTNMLAFGFGRTLNPQNRNPLALNPHRQLNRKILNFKPQTRKPQPYTANPQP